MHKTRIQDLVIGIVVAAVGLFGLSQAVGMPDGTKVYTMCVTGLFALLGTILIVLTIIHKNEPTVDTEFISFQTMKNPLIAFLLVIVYVVLINVLGFFSASAIFMLFFMWWMGYRKPIPMVVTTVVMLGFIYCLFVIQLNVRMPSGILI